ncbi:EAL domain-containing protein [Kyrpidia spormannii]|uniref:EAL domain-containing protein n=1 Tax=Kyrpidia spormannii TaxID=2055160 RepID=UPI0012FFF0AB|nr:EAL domain-containing protein [Kyrpidia spormannii]
MGEIFPGRVDFLRFLTDVHFAYQPIVRMTDHRKIGCELLVRGPLVKALRDPEHLFAHAHTLDILLETDYLIFLQAMAHRPRRDRAFINILAPTVERFALRIYEEFEDLDLDYLVLELTNRLPPSGWTELAEIFEPLRARGLSLALDDVGVRPADMEAAALLQPDFMKIDVSCVERVGAGEAGRHKVERICRMAERIGAQVVAKGVETEEHARILADLGVSLGQGFLFGKPEERRIVYY